ncbi:all-trans retinoic acid-induced differentiation factor [Aplochiton taeniatus]
MNAGHIQLKSLLIISITNYYLFVTCQLTEIQICNRCNGTVLNNTILGQFCNNSVGFVKGRCCLLKDKTGDPEYVIGLDLSNCSLSNVVDLQGASTAELIDLSFNPIVILSDSVFQGFIQLSRLILPSNLECPGGNVSWGTVKVEGGNIICEEQRNICNQTGQLSLNCPESSLCAPYGPGFFECSCTANHHGYKCLREGEFPAVQVFGPLGATTVVVSILLWVTQRRKAKSV